MNYADMLKKQYTITGTRYDHIANSIGNLKVPNPNIVRELKEFKLQDTNFKKSCKTFAGYYKFRLSECRICTKEPVEITMQDVWNVYKKTLKTITKYDNYWGNK